LEFAPLHTLHRALGIRTILAPWFVGSMTLQLPYFVPALKRAHMHEETHLDRLQVRTAFTHFANESLIAAAVERSWLLSRMEVGFFKAAGVHARYFPYYPTGEAVDQLHSLRTKRTAATIDEGLFVITGSSIDHNRISTMDFLQRPDICRFPANARIEIVGIDYSSSERKSVAWRNQPNIVFRGRLPQPEFDDLLVRARAILVPQTCGFGVSTRVIDMLIAGIPVIADEMVANAAGSLPSVQYAADTERGWADAIGTALDQPAIVSVEALDPWLQTSKNLVAQEISNLRN
jgi:hypothetical protein